MYSTYARISSTFHGNASRRLVKAMKCDKFLLTFHDFTSSIVFIVVCKTVKGGREGRGFKPEQLHTGLQTPPPNSKPETSLGRLEVGCRSFRVDLNPSPAMS